MTCAHDEKGLCACAFTPDELDLENEARRVAIDEIKAELRIAEALEESTDE
jgi:hypothetical protein